MRQRAVASGCLILVACGLAGCGGAAEERPATLGPPPITGAQPTANTSSGTPAEPPFYAVIFGSGLPSWPYAMLISSDGRRSELPLSVAGGVFAPRGAAFAYMRYAPTKRVEELHIRKIGGSERIVTLGKPPSAGPVFAADGRIVYAFGNVIRYVDGPSYRLRGVPGVITWVNSSPRDGRTFAVTVTWGNPTTGTEAHSAIYVVSPAGNRRVRVSIDALSESPQPIWSPTGDKIAFVRCGCPRGGDIYIANADGRHVVQLTHTGWAYRPIWSPDGTEVAYTARLGGYSHAPEVYVTTLDGTQRRLTYTTVAPGPGRIPPGSVVGAWSPDGRWIAIFANYDLAIVPVTGGRARTIIANLVPQGESASMTATAWPRR